MAEPESKRLGAPPHQVRFSPSQGHRRAQTGSRWGAVGGEGARHQQLGSRTRSEAGQGRRRHSLTQNGGADEEAGAPGGAPHAPREIRPAAGSWTRAPGPGGRRGPAPRPSPQGGPRPAAPVAARGGAGPESAGSGAAASASARGPRPGTGCALTSDAPPDLPEPGKGGGAAGMNGAGGCSLATPGRSRAAQLPAARAGAAASPSPGTPGSSLAGRPQPTVPSAGVTHSRRSASSLCSRAAPAPTANPPARAARPLLGAGDAALLPSRPGVQAAARQVRARTAGRGGGRRTAPASPPEPALCPGSPH